MEIKEKFQAENLSCLTISKRTLQLIKLTYLLRKTMNSTESCLHLAMKMKMEQAIMAYLIYLWSQLTICFLFPTQFRLKTSRNYIDREEVISTSDWIKTYWSLYSYLDGDKFVHSVVEASIEIDNGRKINIRLNEIENKSGMMKERSWFLWEIKNMWKFSYDLPYFALRYKHQPCWIDIHLFKYFN